MKLNWHSQKIPNMMALVALSLFLVLHLTHGRHVPCHKDESNNTTGLHESFLMMPAYRRGFDVNMDTSTIRFTPLGSAQEATNCEEAQYPGTSENIATSCPWHYTLNVDSNREPEQLVEAVCNCAGRPCLHGSPGSRCLPIKYYIRVNRRVPNFDGELVFQPSIEPVVVGCTCAVPTDAELDDDDE